MRSAGESCDTCPLTRGESETSISSGVLHETVSTYIPQSGAVSVRRRPKYAGINIARSGVSIATTEGNIAWLAIVHILGPCTHTHKNTP